MHFKNIGIFETLTNFNKTLTNNVSFEQLGPGMEVWCLPVHLEAWLSEKHNRRQSDWEQSVYHSSQYQVHHQVQGFILKT